MIFLEFDPWFDFFLAPAATLIAWLVWSGTVESRWRIVLLLATAQTSSAAAPQTS